MTRPRVSFCAHVVLESPLSPRAPQFFVPLNPTSQLFLSNSTVTIDECVRNFQRFTNCSIVDAIEAATLHPAQLLGIEDRKGTLNVNADADLVFLDDSTGEIRVKRVFVAGDEVVLKN